uniref:L-gulonolactone oxidase n=1 Tax=Picea sitchensis TaxID=3332 RepID=D5AAQ1_PICSI|nr:unknown [Picea sitchensis]
MKTVMYRKDDREPVSSDGNGVNDFIGFQPTSKKALTTIRKIEEIAEATNKAGVKCSISKIEFDMIIKSGTGLKNDGHKFLGYPVIGYQNDMQSSGSCLASADDTACPWDPRIKGIFFFEIGIGINISKIGPFLSDVKKLRDKISRNSFCGVELYNGFLMRYVKASSAYLGKQEDSVEIEITYYRSKDPSTPRLYEDVLEEIEQMALMKYGALPHWGKNRNLAFDGVLKKYNKYEAFLQVKSKYDPQGLFSNEWTDGVLEIGQVGVIIKKDGCALEGLCVCSEDKHCAPDKGYFCKSGRVYKEARVCRRQEEVEPSFFRAFFQMPGWCVWTGILLLSSWFALHTRADPSQLFKSSLWPTLEPRS